MKAKKSTGSKKHKRVSSLAVKTANGECRPSGKYPALYYQEGYTAEGSRCGDRLRIVYPSGRTEYFWNPACTWDIPCWSRKSKSFAKQVQAMHEYDVHRTFGPAIYLGEIK